MSKPSYSSCLFVIFIIIIFCSQIFHWIVTKMLKTNNVINAAVMSILIQAAPSLSVSFATHKMLIFFIHIWLLILGVKSNDHDLISICVEFTMQKLVSHNWTWTVILITLIFAIKCRYSRSIDWNASFIISRYIEWLHQY